VTGAYTSNTGKSKLVSRHPIHVMVDVEEYRKFYRWCADHGTNPTARVRELIIEHNQKHGGTTRG
jgi:hypothetical protein